MYDSSGFKKLVIQYLEFLVAEDFNYSYEMDKEVIFTENIVSKSIIIVTDFSQKIETDTALRNYLSIVISNINLRIIQREDMFRMLNQ